MTPAKLNTARILIIEDYQPSVEVLLRFFEMNSYENIKAITDSRLAEKEIAEFKPDLMLLDLNMPFVSGFDILEKLKDIIPANDYLPVLVLTADITLVTKRKALQMGASDFITKPFDLLELQARVNTHLQIRFKNEQIKAYAEELKKLVATKDKFFSIVAHDIRNPLAGITNFSASLLSRLDTMPMIQLKDDIRTINVAAQHGQDLLSNLLKWSQSQTGSIKVSVNSIFLNESIDALIKAFSTQAKNKRITLKAAVEGEIVIDTDSEMLDTILRNLMNNAIKFTSEYGQITVSAVEEDDFVEISISDTGVGIAAEDSEKLFKIDSKMYSKKGTANEKGSGLGLILCSEFAIKMKGKLRVESKLKKGTKMTLRLPLEYS